MASVQSAIALIPCDLLAWDVPSNSAAEIGLAVARGGLALVPGSPGDPCSPTFALNSRRQWVEASPRSFRELLGQRRGVVGPVVGVILEARLHQVDQPGIQSATRALGRKAGAPPWPPGRPAPRLPVRI